MVHLRSVTLPDQQFWARDNLANERTYLAWLKTSLTFVSVGIALAQINKFASRDSVISIGGFVIHLKGNTALTDNGNSYGSVCVILGILVLLMGTFRFYYVQTVLMEKKFPVANVSVAFTALAVVICIALYLNLASRI
ncbi:hypothetical protein OXX79_010628 [Metschnikowia pulcherrima]